MKRFALAAARNAEPIARVLDDWLPASGIVLELASGSGEHGLTFARRFPALQWQPSDASVEALGSIAEWREEGPANFLSPLSLDVAEPCWPITQADALVAINLVHISPWESVLGLLDGAARLLARGAPLILYGPWIEDGVETAPSNLAFHADLRARDARWGLRRVPDFIAESRPRGLMFAERRAMPANNIMLKLLRD